MATMNVKDAEFQKKLTFAKVFDINDSHVSPGVAYGGTIVRFRDNKGRPQMTEEVLLKRMHANPPYLQAYYFEDSTLSKHSFAIDLKHSFAIALNEKCRRKTRINS